MKTSHIIAITTLLVCFAVTPEMYADGRKFADDDKVTPAEVHQETRELNDNPRDNSLDE